MTEAEWVACEDPVPMLRYLSGADRRAAERRLRLFACGCGRVFWPGATDPRLADAIAAAERFADGEAGEAELARLHPEHPRYPAASDREGLIHELTRPPLWSAAADDVPHHLLGGYTLPSARCLLGGRRAGPPPPGTRSGTHPWHDAHAAGAKEADVAMAGILRCLAGNPFRPVTFIPEWRTSTVVALARQMYESRDFGAMPILADALQDAGCDREDTLSHCRDPQANHVRGCWVVDLVLGRE
jgi:hypothetical protein